MTITTFHVAGMSCSHCEHAVTEEVSRIDGVESIEVSAQSGELRVTSAGPISDEDVLAAVDEAGYTARRA